MQRAPGPQPASRRSTPTPRIPGCLLRAARAAEAHAHKRRTALYIRTALSVAPRFETPWRYSRKVIFQKSEYAISVLWNLKPEFWCWLAVCGIAVGDWDMGAGAGRAPSVFRPKHQVRPLKARGAMPATPGAMPAPLSTPSHRQDRHPDLPASAFGSPPNARSCPTELPTRKTAA